MAPVGLTMLLKRKLRLLPEPVTAAGRSEVQGIFYRLEKEEARKEQEARQEGKARRTKGSGKERQE
jgi:hypothetical protein